MGIIKVSTWNNGKPNYETGSGLGLKLNKYDRDQYLTRKDKEVILEVEGEGECIPVNIDKKSFWNNTCIELISSKIGRWLINNGYHTWKRGMPHKLELQHISRNRFLLKRNN